MRIFFSSATQLVPDWDLSVASGAGAMSSHLNVSFSLLGDLRAQNQTFQNASDWIKLCGVNEWVGADIEKLWLFVDDQITPLSSMHIIMEPVYKYCWTTFRQRFMAIGDKNRCRYREMR